MILFYCQCIEKYPNITNPKSLNIVGHSLGGALTQMLTLSLCDNENEANINEVYTFNSPGAKNLRPTYDVMLDNKDTLEKCKQILIDEAKRLNYDMSYNNIDNKLKELLSDKTNIEFIGIKFYFNNDEVGTLSFVYNKISHNISSYYKTIINNYNNRNIKDEKGNNYELSISDRIFHIETFNKRVNKKHTKESYKDNATQHLGKDIDGGLFSF